MLRFVVFSETCIDLEIVPQYLRENFHGRPWKSTLQTLSFASISAFYFVRSFVLGLNVPIHHAVFTAVFIRVRLSPPNSFRPIFLTALFIRVCLHAFRTFSGQLLQFFGLFFSMISSFYCVHSYPCQLAFNTSCLNLCPFMSRRVHQIRCVFIYATCDSGLFLLKPVWSFQFTPCMVLGSLPTFVLALKFLSRAPLDLLSKIRSRSSLRSTSPMLNRKGSSS